MQEETKQTPMVDIDTSGPEQEIELNDEAQTEEQVETAEQETSPEPQATSDEKQEAEGLFGVSTSSTAPGDASITRREDSFLLQ